MKKRGRHGGSFAMKKIVKKHVKQFNRPQSDRRITVKVNFAWRERQNRPVWAVWDELSIQEQWATTSSNNLLAGPTTPYETVSIDEAAVRTDNFSKSRCIGKGAFWRCILSELEGKKISFKKPKGWRDKVLKERVRELRVLADCKHANLVRLNASTSEFTIMAGRLFELYKKYYHEWKF